MANLRDIKKRIDSVKSTKQITRTMEMVSSAKIGSATRRVTAATPYANAMAEMLSRMSSAVASSQHPLLAKHDEVRNALVVAIVSDRGLAGGFNTNVLRECDRIVNQLKARGAQCKTIACGKKAIAYFAYRKYEVIASYVDLSADPTMDEAREVASICARLYESGEADEVYMVYNHARNAGDQDLRCEMLLPVQPVAVDEKTEGEQAEAARPAQDQAPAAPFDFEPDAESVLSVLLPSYLDTVVYHGLIDSAAAEQGARRKAMKAATDNATDMIDSLQRLYNRIRQGAITTELTEIVSGAAAAE